MVLLFERVLIGTTRKGIGRLREFVLLPLRSCANRVPGGGSSRRQLRLCLRFKPSMEGLVYRGKRYEPVLY